MRISSNFLGLLLAAISTTASADTFRHGQAPAAKKLTGQNADKAELGNRLDQQCRDLADYMNAIRDNNKKLLTKDQFVAAIGLKGNDPEEILKRLGAEQFKSDLMRAVPADQAAKLTYRDKASADAAAENVRKSILQSMIEKKEGVTPEDALSRLQELKGQMSADKPFDAAFVKDYLKTMVISEAYNHYAEDKDYHKIQTSYFTAEQLTTYQQLQSSNDLNVPTRIFGKGWIRDKMIKESTPGQ